MRIKIFRKAVLFGLSALVACVGCKKREDHTFAGTDNYITAFALEQGGVVYPAAIAGSRIELAVPAGVDLTGATARYAISERSVIAPDPAAIEDWSVEVRFTVTSYGQQSRSYTCSVTRGEAVETGSVVLRTQAEAEAFGARNIARIEGHLTLGAPTGGEGFDSIRSLAPLASLVEVGGNVQVGATLAAGTLRELAALQRAGNLYIGTVSAEAALGDSLEVALPALETVGEIVANSPQVRTVELPALTDAWSLFVNGRSIATLNLDALREVSGNLTLQSGTNTAVATANQRLEAIELPALERVLGAMALQGWIAAERVGLPRLRSVGGNLSFGALSRATAVEIPVLEQVGGRLSFSTLDALTAFEAAKLKSLGAFSLAGGYSARPVERIELPLLERVAGDFELSYVSAERLDLPLLQEVGGQFKLNYAEQLTELSVPKLARCENLYLGGIGLLPTLDLSEVAGLEKVELVSGYALETVKLPRTIGDLSLNGGSRATALPRLEGVEEIAGTVSVSNYRATEVVLTSVKRLGVYSQTSGSGQTRLAFPDLEEIGTLRFSLTDLTTLSAPKLTTAENFDWSSFWSLATIELGALRTVSGELRLWGASYAGAASRCLLTDLDAFASLVSVGSVHIQWCGRLNDFSGLRNALPSLDAERWRVEGCRYNPTYREMTEGAYAGQ